MAGHKHSCVALIAAAALTESTVVLGNVPDIEDVRVLAKILDGCGARVDRCGDRLELSGKTLRDPVIPAATSQRVHGSLYLVPAFLGRLGVVRYAGSGGCRIGDPANDGERPVEHVLRVLERFGARFVTKGGELEGAATGFCAADLDVMEFSERGDLLTGPLVSGTTKTALLAAAAADGVSVIANPYPKPDVLELVEFLRSCGHAIDADPGRLRVLAPAGGPRTVRYHLAADLGEVLTYLVAGLLLDVPVRVTGSGFGRARDGLRPEIELLEAMGVALTWGSDWVEARAPRRWSAVDVEVTSIGIYSDHQPFFALLLTLAQQPARIVEHVWEGRFGYARELEKLGARVAVRGNVLEVEPAALGTPEQPLLAGDVRAAACLLLAALSVEGPTVVEGVEHLSRGYVDLLTGLRALGARIEALPEAEK